MVGCRSPVGQALRVGISVLVTRSPHAMAGRIPRLALAHSHLGCVLKQASGKVYMHSTHSYNAGSLACPDFRDNFDAVQGAVRRTLTTRRWRYVYITSHKLRIISFHSGHPRRRRGPFSRHIARPAELTNTQRQGDIPR